MKTAIAQAQEIYEKGDKATASEILTAIDALNQAVSLYEDATLSDLRIDGNSINGSTLMLPITSTTSRPENSRL